MRDFNENVGKSNPARAAYDLELELIERDLGLISTKSSISWKPREGR
jgi:hypothetical protein